MKYFSILTDAFLVVAAFAFFLAFAFFFCPAPCINTAGAVGTCFIIALFAFVAAVLCGLASEK